MFWLALLVPAVILGQWVLPILKQKSIWFVLTLVFGTLLTIWLAMGVSTLDGDQRTATGLWKMLAFRILVYTDVPLVQTLIAAVIGWGRSSRSRKTQPEYEVAAGQTEPSPANSFESAVTGGVGRIESGSLVVCRQTAIGQRGGDASDNSSSERSSSTSILA